MTKELLVFRLRQLLVLELAKVLGYKLLYLSYFDVLGYELLVLERAKVLGYELLYFSYFLKNEAR